MEILKNNTNLNIVINTEQNFRTDLGWEENFADFEKEVLEDIINPAKNYETVRYIHRPYSSVTLNNKEQCDIWFKFYFISGSTYVQDYSADNVGITLTENELMLKQSTESFFRLEFYKTPGTVTNGILTCDPPTRQNRRFVNAKNLSLPLGEKFFYESSYIGFYIHLPIFTGSNYRNKENMYLFWFDDESTLKESSLSGTTTLDKYTFVNTGSTHTILFTNEKNEITQINIPNGTTVLSGWTGQTFTINNTTVTYDRNYYHGMNTFFMTAKFFNGKDGSILDFTNQAFSTGHTVTEEKDMYYQVDFDNFERTYQVYKYSGGTKGERVGISSTGLTTSIDFYEKGGAIKLTQLPTTPTPTPTPISLTPTATPTPLPIQYWYHLKRCDTNGIEYSVQYNDDGYFSIGDIVYGHYTKFYYTITGKTATTNPNPGSSNVVIDKSSYTRCEDTPNYVAPLNRSQITLVDMPFYSGLTQTQLADKICNKTISEIPAGDGTPTVITGWVDDNPYVYGTTYTLYTTSTGYTISVGNNRYYGVIENNVFKSVVFLTSTNSVNNLFGWKSCGTFVSGQCYGYVNNTSYTSLIDYTDCNTGTQYYSVSIAPYSGICAVYGTVYVLSGSDMFNTYVDCKNTPTPSPTPSPTPTGAPTFTPTPTPTLQGPTPTPTSTPTVTPTPTPTATSVPGSFGGTVTFGTYPVTSVGSATLTIQNTTSLDKYIWLRSNSAYLTSGTLSGSASITTIGYEDTISVSNTITGTNQTFDSGPSFYIPAGSTYTINVVHSSPSAGSFYLVYVDTNTPTKTNIPIL
jgi:hypothetical protein